MSDSRNNFLTRTVEEINNILNDIRQTHPSKDFTCTTQVMNSLNKINLHGWQTTSIYQFKLSADSASALFAAIEIFDLTGHSEKSNQLINFTIILNATKPKDEKFLEMEKKLKNELKDLSLNSAINKLIY